MLSTLKLHPKPLKVALAPIKTVNIMRNPKADVPMSLFHTRPVYETFASMKRTFKYLPMEVVKTLKRKSQDYWPEPQNYTQQEYALIQE